MFMLRPFAIFYQYTVRKHRLSDPKLLPNVNPKTVRLSLVGRV
jgi:hypothetical protein